MSDFEIVKLYASSLFGIRYKMLTIANAMFNYWGGFIFPPYQRMLKALFFVFLQVPHLLKSHKINTKIIFAFYSISGKRIST